MESSGGFSVSTALSQSVRMPARSQVSLGKMMRSPWVAGRLYLGAGDCGPGEDLAGREVGSVGGVIAGPGNEVEVDRVLVVGCHDCAWCDQGCAFVSGVKELFPWAAALLFVRFPWSVQC